MSRQNCDKLIDLLREAKLQIEYLHNKFTPTGTGNSLLSRINSALGEIDSQKKPSKFRQLTLEELIENEKKNKQ